MSPTSICCQACGPVYDVAGGRAAVAVAVAEGIQSVPRCWRHQRSSMSALSWKPESHHDPPAAASRLNAHLADIRPGNRVGPQSVHANAADAQGDPTASVANQAAASMAAAMSRPTVRPIAVAPSGRPVPAAKSAAHRVNTVAGRSHWFRAARRWSRSDSGAWGSSNHGSGAAGPSGAGPRWASHHCRITSALSANRGS
jgi:hypothetical protein